MALPEQIQKAKDASEKAYEKAYGNKEAEGNTEASGTNTEETAGNEAATETPKEGNVVNAPEPTPAENERTGRKETISTDESLFEHRFKVLQGKYDAEVPRLYKEIEQLRQQNQLILAEAQKARAEEKPAEPAKKSTAGATPEEVEEYGQDFIDFVRRVAREEVVTKAREIEAYLNNVNQRVNSVGETVQVSAKEKFLGKLAKEVPDWERWNVDKGFLDWLAGVDEVTGYARKPALDEAAANLNVDRVIRMFNAYKKLVGVSVKPAETRKPVASDPKSKKQRELERMVLPGTKKGSSVRNTDEPKTYTREEIKAFYVAVKDGDFKGREDEQNKIERDIMLAQVEGRITL
ncbi:MAG: hypothetical protein M0P33_00040 [Massilibacteroides sp.]|nr:hypothetical protein [Massilibacteroides sp.]